jgi:hypothetical protein
MIAVVGIGLAVIVVGVLPGRRRPFIGLAAANAVAWIGAGLLVAPAIDGLRSGRDLVHSAEALVGPGQELALVDWPEQFLLQAQRPVFHFGFRRDPDEELEDAFAWLRGDPDRRVLVSSDRAGDCVAGRDHVDVGRAHRRDWWLIDSRSVAPACLDSAPARPGELHRYVRPGRESRGSGPDAAR